MKILNRAVSCFMIIAVVIAFMPLITEDAYAASKYATKAARTTQNEKMYKKAASMGSAARARYLNTSLSDMNETNFQGLSKAEQKEIKEFAEDILAEAGNPTDDMQKIKALHDWVKYNFYYYRNVESLAITKKYSNKVSVKGKVDNPAALLKMYKNMESENLQGVIARCKGYSAMFIALCRSQGIPAAPVVGYYNESVRHNSDANVTWAPTLADGVYDHQWAMAYVNGQWVQVDCNADSYNQYKSGSTYWKQSGGSFASGERYNYFNPTAARLAQSHIIYNFAQVTKINAPAVRYVKKSGSTSVKLGWRAPYGASSYKVYRATSKNGTYKCVKTTSMLYCTDKSLTKGKTYYYKIKAYNGIISSSYSTTYSVKL